MRILSKFEKIEKINLKINLEKKRKILTRNVPQIKTRPSSSKAAVCESPADINVTLPGMSTFPGSNSLPSTLVSRPKAPSSLQPKV